MLYPKTKKLCYTIYCGWLNQIVAYYATFVFAPLSHSPAKIGDPKLATVATKPI